jgi:hypothetical protein
MNTQHEFNEKFRTYVCERHPGWSDHFVPSGASDPEGDFVSLVLFNPRGQEWPMLEASTEGLRLTVNFGVGMHHAHFKDEQVETAISDGCELVEGILQERIVSVVLYQGASPYVSDFCHIENLPAWEEASRPWREAGWVRRLLGMGERPDPGNQTTWRSYGPVHYMLGPPPSSAVAGLPRLDVVSWLGTHDRRTVLT